MTDYIELDPLPLFSEPLPDILTQEPNFFTERANATVTRWNEILQAQNQSFTAFNNNALFINEQVLLAQQQVTAAGSAGAEQVALAAEQVGLAQTAAGQAQVSAEMAAAVANNRGDWSLLSGAFAEGLAVLHAGDVWISNNAIADVAASEPSDVNSDWFNYTGAITGIVPVASNTDTTAGRAITVGWLGYGANNTAPAFADLNNVTKTNGLFFRAAAGATNAPTTKALAGRMTQLNASGAFMQEAMWSDDGASGYAYRFTDPANSAAWSSWIVPGAGLLFGVSDPGAARTAIGAAAAGAVGSSGLTMATGRVLARSSAGGGAVEELTGAQVRSLINAAQSGRLGTTGITSATARIFGRITAGTGNAEELTGAQTLSLLGLVSNSGHLFGAVNLGYYLIRFAGFVIGEFSFTAVNSNSFAFQFGQDFPSGWRPTNSEVCGLMVGAGQSSQTGQARISISTDGKVYVQSVVAAAGKFAVTLCYKA